MRLEVKADVADRKENEKNDDLQVTPVATRDDLARGRGGDEQEETPIDHERGQPADDAREGHGETSGRPRGDKGDERPSLKRQPSGPVGNSGQQETGDDGGNIAV